MLLEAIPVPLREDDDGGLRIGQSRVQLDRLIAARAQGATAEDIVRMYDTLDLADVHAVLAWMLRHPEEVASYVNRREEQAAAIRQQGEDRGVVPGPEFKETLQARRAARQDRDHAAPSQ